ncbi:MAG: GNAT family N-acetyltransferase [Spirochaetaceae bacterium]|jgi:GNAT superfamily N-acetyltransferase|nr:GNAT family N-acetyltransferase [Spirochaetaceae bacterium]
MKWEKNNFYITDSKENINMDYIISSIQNTYWGEGRPSEIIKKTIANSQLLSAFDQEKQIGFARIVSDFASFSWLCDVFIDTHYRGKGLGKFLMSCISEHPSTQVRMNILATKDAHGFYEQFGYERREMMFKKSDYK